MTETITVTFKTTEEGKELTAAVSSGDYLFDAADMAGVEIMATCGRRGRLPQSGM